MKDLNAADLARLMHLIAQRLVDSPECVSVAVSQGDKTTVVKLTVAKQDIGQIIGKHGRMAEALRVILSAVSFKQGKRAILEIVEPG